MLKVYCVFEWWYDENKELNKTMFGIYDSLEKANEIVAKARKLAINKTSDFEIEAWRVQ